MLEVTRNNDNTSLEKRLRSACEHNVRLPSGISFTCRGTTVQMHLDSDCVRANMQTNAAAFEGWALALKRWLPDVAGVELSWDFDGNVCGPHYQRFLYRTKGLSVNNHHFVERNHTRSQLQQCEI